MATIPESTVTAYERVKRGFSELGYVGGLLRENYQFADILSPDLPVRLVPLATFIQEPPSYHTACFGVVIADGLNGIPLVSNYRSLGAPQILEITSRGFCRWRLQTYGNPILLGEIELDQIDQFFQNRSDWSRDNLVRVKSALPSQVTSQLDFFDIGLLPLLDHEVQVKLDRLLTRIISAALDTLKERLPLTQEILPSLFRLIFRLIAAKIFSDRQHPGNWLQDDPKEVVKEVERFYFRNEAPEPVLQDDLIQFNVWDNIRKAFRFHNLSVEALAYVYENTLMTKETRRATSTHGTPPAIAEYIVRHLPFDSLQDNERHVFEPFSGHAVFLVAAMRRLRELLPAGATPSGRHDYFKSMLSGLERSDFAREVARLSLMLADYPNPDGWKLYSDDAFASTILERELASANVVLCNPPFEDFTQDEQAKYSNLLSPHKPAAILQKVLQKPPKLLGFVLPRVFVSGRGYRRIRQILGNTYSSIEIVALPDNTFKYSAAETVLMIASGNKTGSISFAVGEVPKGLLQSFYSTHQPSYQAKANLIASATVFNSNMWLRVLSDVWEATAHLKSLEDVAIVHRGIEYNVSLREDASAVIAKEPRPSFAPGLHRVSDGLELFYIGGHKYLNLDPKLMRTNAYKLPWSKPKVIVNARRRSSGSWKITASPDYERLYCYQSFDGVWPSTNISLEVLAAILNNPLANAYLASIEGQRDIRVETIKHIPVPTIIESTEKTVISLVTEYRSIRTNWQTGELDGEKAAESCKRVLQAIDAEILKSYDLSPRTERALLDYFMGYQRPAPIEFNEYYPRDFKPFIPWWHYISREFERATVKETLKRLPLINDSIISEALSELA